MFWRSVKKVCTLEKLKKSANNGYEKIKRGLLTTKFRQNKNQIKRIFFEMYPWKAPQTSLQDNYANISVRMEKMWEIWPTKLLIIWKGLNSRWYFALLPGKNYNWNWILKILIGTIRKYPFLDFAYPNHQSVISTIKRCLKFHET